MTTATLSSRGQIVIPAAIRKQKGFKTGDVFTFRADPKTEEITIERVETLDEMTARFNSWIKPGTVPLENTREFFNQRPYRM